MFLASCTLTLYGVTSEKFYTGEQLDIEIPQPDDFEEILMVMSNSLVDLPSFRCLVMNTFYPKEGYPCGINWDIHFERGTLEWDNHVTLAERQDDIAY